VVVAIPTTPNTRIPCTCVATFSVTEEMLFEVTKMSIEECCVSAEVTRNVGVSMVSRQLGSGRDGYFGVNQLWKEPSVTSHDDLAFNSFDLPMTAHSSLLPISPLCTITDLPKIDSLPYRVILSVTNRNLLLEIVPRSPA
jgi:hypothetical protein